MIDQLLNDLRFGARVLIRNPGSTLMAVLVLAIGIGANTTIFSVVDSVLLRPLHYRDSERLVMVWQTLHQDALVPLSLPDYFEVKSQSKSLEQISAAFLNKEDYSVTGQGEPEQVSGMAVSANLFATLGVSPSQGRNFQPGEDQAGRDRVVIISHALWLRKFGGETSVLGRLLTIDGEPHEIIGVMPAAFQFPPPISSGALRLSSDRELWIPYVPREPSRENHPVAVIARLKPDAQLATARVEIETVMQRMEHQYPDTNSGIGGSLVSMRELVVQNVRRPLWLLLGAVGLVLLVACANIASLLLVRAEGRRREIAIRSALGAGRGRIARQLLTESMLLSVTGGFAGLMITLWGVDLLRTVSSNSVPRLAELKIDPSVLAFTLLLSIVTGVLFGFAPAWFGSRTEVAESLKQGGRGPTGTASGRMRNLLVIAEVAIAVILLVGGGLLVRSFMRLLAVDPGFNLHNLQTAGIRLPAVRYHDDQRVVDFTQSLIQRVESLPGVVSAGTVNSLPINGFKAATLFFIEGEPHPGSFAETPMANGRSVSPGYFGTMGIPIVSGRNFTDEDRIGSTAVVIINRAMRRRHFAGDPIGKRIRIDSDTAPLSVIVGVAGDVHDSGLEEEPDPEMYTPQAQTPWRTMALVVRTGYDSGNLGSAIREQVWSIDKEQPVLNSRSMAEIVSDSVASRRFNLLLLSLFAGAALLLAALGVYGVMSHFVLLRTQEIGVRMALGALPGDVLRMVIAQGVKLAAVGVAVGLAGSLLVGKVLASLLFGVSPRDPLTFVVIALVLMMVALVASYLPARRATRMDPLVALRSE